MVLPPILRLSFRSRVPTAVIMDETIRGMMRHLRELRNSFPTNPTYIACRVEKVGFNCSMTTPVMIPNNPAKAVANATQLDTKNLLVALFFILFFIDLSIENVPMLPSVMVDAVDAI